MSYTIDILFRFCSKFTQTSFIQLLTACSFADGRISNISMRNIGILVDPPSCIAVISPILGWSFGEFQNCSEQFLKNCFGVVFFWNFRNVVSFCSRNYQNRLAERGERVFQSLQLAIENVHTQMAQYFKGEVRMTVICVWTFSNASCKLSKTRSPCSANRFW